MKTFHIAVLSVAMPIALASSLPLSGQSATGQSSKTSVTANQESPFACDRMALSPEDRKRHFDELGPELRSRRKSVRELPDGYEFEYPSDTASIKLVAE